MKTSTAIDSMGRDVLVLKDEELTTEWVVNNDATGIGVVVRAWNEGKCVDIQAIFNLDTSQVLTLKEHLDILLKDVL